jgi:cobalt-zinc-cadmium efflux system membrane fusion protein
MRVVLPGSIAAVLQKSFQKCFDAALRRVGGTGMPAVLGSVVIVIAASAVLALVYGEESGSALDATSAAQAATSTDAPSAATADPDSVNLSEAQLSAVKVEPIAARDFPNEKDAIGSIDFNEDLEVQVFTPYQGRIISLFADIGDDVKKGQTLFTIDSPDLLQAESTLIAAAGVLELTTRNLARLQELYATRAVSQHDLEQASSDQQTAEGNLRAARDAVRIFGKSDADIDHIISQRSADPTLVVASPINGRITTRNAAPGLFVQPGNAPAPYTVADIDTMWMLANVTENDSPDFHVGQQVRVQIIAFPGRVFDGKVTTVGAIVDPNTRRVLVRSEINDPRHELRSGMFAHFVISTGSSDRSPALPLSGVVREGDGTQTVWITADRRRFTKRTVTIGGQRDGFRQIVDGVRDGELAATDGAIFLSNMLATAGNQ